MDAEFDELRREFLDEANAKVQEIESMLGPDEVGSESVERSIYLAHQLKGAGGSYGFQVISTEGAALEADLEKLGGGNRTVRPSLQQRIENLHQEIEKRMRELQPAG